MITHVEHTTPIINNQIKFKNSMLNSSLYDYSDAVMLVKETMTV